MGALKIIVGVVVIGGAGYAGYLYFKKQKEKKQLADLAGAAAAASSVAPGSIAKPSGALQFNYCYPPINPLDIERELKKFYYKRALATDMWNAQGRGMSLEAYMDKLNQQANCK